MHRPVVSLLGFHALCYIEHPLSNVYTHASSTLRQTSLLHRLEHQVANLRRRVGHNGASLLQGLDLVLTTALASRDDGASVLRGRRWIVVSLKARFANTNATPFSLPSCGQAAQYGQQ